MPTRPPPSGSLPPRGTPPRLASCRPLPTALPMPNAPAIPALPAHPLAPLALKDLNGTDVHGRGRLIVRQMRLILIEARMIIGDKRRQAPTVSTSFGASR